MVILRSMAIVTSDHDSVRAGELSTLSWQKALKEAIRDPVELCRTLRLPVKFEIGAQQAAAEFPVFAPKDFVAKMEVGNPSDPLLRQVLPVDEELLLAPGYVSDPVGDLAAQKTPGLIQKYHGRALAITTGRCAVHCRYCFRREYPYAEGPRSHREFAPLLQTIEADSTIEEILLSGGDPLTVVDEGLSELIEQLENIGHLRRLRIHTRLPIVIPQRVTDALLESLQRTRLVSLVVVHANHPAEIDYHVAAALQRIVDAGIPVLNQSVLLRGVNDCAETLSKLSEKLIDCRVMPYYLNQLDRVNGTAHFEVEVDVGKSIIAEMRTRLPGYAVPRYVQEQAGDQNKRPLA